MSDKVSLIHHEKMLKVLNYLIECTGDIESLDADPELREGIDAIRAAIESRPRVSRALVQQLAERVYGIVLYKNVEKAIVEILREAGVEVEEKP